jgi:hypothetical protein
MIQYLVLAIACLFCIINIVPIIYKGYMTFIHIPLHQNMPCSPAL